MRIGFGKPTAAVGVLAATCVVVACSSSSSPAPAAHDAPRPPLAQALRGEPGTVSMFPSPGSRTAMPTTQITLRGASVSDVGSVAITGSRSGAHQGQWVADPDGNGANFLPAKPFTTGETVTVHTGLAIRGSHGGNATFTVATPATETTPPVMPQRKTAPPAVTTYASRPTVRVPAVRVTTNTTAAGPGLVAIAAKGGGLPGELMLMHSDGSVVWDQPLPTGVTADNLQEQRYEGRPVLTWWQGAEHPHGYGDGVDVLMDNHYRTVATVDAGNGLQADVHDFQLTSGGTALLTAFEPIRWNLTPYGGPANGLVLDSIVQEVDVRTGLVLFDWHALDHISPTASFIPVTTNGTTAWDYFHVNSIDVAPDGNLLVSARHTSALYELDRATGDVLWTLGGKASDFRMGAGTTFVFQHDARWRPDGSLTVFDDGGGPPRGEAHSRALRLRVSMAAHTVSLVQSYAPPTPITTNSQGNAQQLPGGDLVVGWGDQPYITEFSPAGQVVWAATLPAGVSSYRAYRIRWTGQPTAAPAVGVTEENGQRTVHVSWNGDTRTRSWRLVTGSGAGSVTRTRRTGFDTALPLPAGAAHARVEALDASGRLLTSVPVPGL